MSSAITVTRSIPADAADLHSQRFDAVIFIPRVKLLPLSPRAVTLWPGGVRHRGRRHGW
jgi:hypothetical protein